MTDKNDRDEVRPEKSQSKNGPSHLAYDVKDIGEEKSAWNRVGAAWQHRDGKGFDIALDALPLSGRVTLREQRKEEFKERRSEQAQNQDRGQEQGQDQSQNRDDPRGR